MDVAGGATKIKALYAHDAVGKPMDVVVTNSASADATLTMTKGGGKRPRYVARDGENGALAMCYDAAEGAGDDLSDALFQNRALTISHGTFASAARTADFNRPLWKTAPAVSGRYLRLVVTNSTVGSSQYMGLLRIAEFRLTMGGHPVAWPAGTTASSPNSLPGPKATEDEGFDRGAQAMIDGDMDSFWRPADFVVGNHPATNVIDMTREVAFNGYQMAAGGTVKSSCPSGWTLEVGRRVGDEIVWEQVTGAWPDEKIGEASPSNRNYYMQMYESVGRYFEDCILPLNVAEGVKTWQGPQFQNADFALAVSAPGSFALTDHLESVASLSGDGTLTLNGSRLFAADTAGFTGALTVDATSFVGGGSTLAVNGTLTVGNAESAEAVETDALDDTALVSVGEYGRLALRQARETIGGLAGTGTVDLGGGALTLAEPVESGFGGAFTGGGTLTWTDGTFRGAATAEGDYTVRLAGGRWAGRLDVSGTLTLDGKLVVDPSGMEYGRHTLFTFGSLGAGSEAVVAAAVATPKPQKPYRARVSVEGNAVVLDVYAPLMLIIR